MDDTGRRVGETVEDSGWRDNDNGSDEPARGKLVGHGGGRVEEEEKEEEEEGEVEEEEE